MSGLTIPIPPGHVAYWKQTDQGIKVEFLRFLDTTDRKSRRPRGQTRRQPDKFREMTDAERAVDAAEGSAKLLLALREALR